MSKAEKVSAKELRELKAVLHPKKTGVSPRMASFLGFFLGEKWARPQIGSISITSDGFLVSGNRFLGRASDLDESLRELFDAVGLSQELRDVFTKVYRKKVLDYRSKKPTF